MNDMSEGYHYNVMRRAIELIDAHSAEGGEVLSLDQLAGEMGMSPAHFQRLFTKWTGVSPKKYQQYLTLGHAKALLRDRGIEFEEIDVTEDAELRDWLVEATGGRRTVPAIFFGDECFGGCDELVELDRTGGLAKLVAD